MMESFFALTPERILDTVESALPRESRATGRIQALNSVENRVYLIELENGESVVAKFYRPRRWTAEQILEEHLFIGELHRAEVPVVPPIILGSGSTLSRTDDGIHFAVFPRARARMLDELDDQQTRQLGRFLARLHAVGERLTRTGRITHRLRLDMRTYGRESLDFLLASPFLDEVTRPRYQMAAEATLALAESALAGAKTQVVHGDCHLGNVLWNQVGPFFVDFDDVVIAPPVQDVWMIVRGRDEAAQRQRENLLSGYEEMREFDRSSLQLIEPLRALRLIHYSAWIARRWEDPSFPRMFPHFGSARYWQEEIEALESTRAEIR